MATEGDLKRLHPARIALLKPSALGDVVQTLPVLTALRRHFPHAHISWIVNRTYAPLLEGHPDLDEVIPFDRQSFRRGWIEGGLGFARFLSGLRRRRFDLVLDLQGLLRTGLMMLATGAPIRLGFATAREGARWCCTHPIDDTVGGQNAVERYWRMVEALGAGDLPKTFRLPIPPKESAWAEDMLRDLPRPWIGVGPGARWLTKRWPPRHFADLVNRCLENFGGTALFIGAPDEAVIARQVQDSLRGPSRMVAGRTTLRQLAAVLSRVDVLLANDTGPLHLAVALGRPIAAPYTCTQVARNGPYGQEHRAVETSVWCRGSYIRKCDRLECMDDLTPERLWPVLSEVLSAWQSRRHTA